MSLYVKYLICYDIPDNKLRKRLSDSLKDMGLIPLQKSVFYGDLKPPEVRALAGFAKRYLNPKVDKCFWFPCYLKVEQMRHCVGYEDFIYEEPDGFRFL